MRNRASRPFAVGDEVLLHFWRGGHREITGVVTKVARKWATVQSDSHEYKIDIQTGVGAEERKDYGSEHTGWHPEDWEIEQERTELTREVVKFFNNMWGPDNLTIDQLRAIRDVIKQPDEVGERQQHE